MANIYLNWFILKENDDSTLFNDQEKVSNTQKTFLLDREIDLEGNYLLS